MKLIKKDLHSVVECEVVWELFEWIGGSEAIFCEEEWMIK
jgi:hypothetical protein